MASQPSAGSRPDVGPSGLHEEANPSGDERVPLPPATWARRPEGPAGAASPEDLLRKVRVDPNVLQEHRPLTRSLEWELSELSWRLLGVRSFTEGDVPFVVNNSGALSENAAVVLFACCEEARPGEGPITALELGAGTGLFARYVLDAFRAICEQEGKDYYHRLRYLVTDGSPTTVAQWRERRIFDDHQGRVILGVCSALAPEIVRSPEGEPIDALAPLAVFCNYLFDVLPAAVIARGAGGAPEELSVRTHLTQDRELVAHRTTLSVEQVRALAESEDPSDRARLIPLMPLFDLEMGFLPLDAELASRAEEALTLAEETPRVLWNHGALTFLERASRLVGPHGFILVNDYGPVRLEQAAECRLPQRFGASSALGVNFGLIERWLARRGATVEKPEGDDDRALHARLVCARDLPRTKAAFHARFSARAQEHVEAPLADARRHGRAGRIREALDAYHLALSRGPRDWTLIGEAAEFVAAELKDYESALELCRRAIELNPWYSPWLWNVLGDCVFCLGRYEEAHDAYLQARRISPGDARTNLNLAYTHAQFGRLEQALEAIARGLTTAHKSGHQDRLLAKQQQVLSAIASRWSTEQNRLLQRSARST